MVERTSLVVAKFIQQLVKHEVKLPTLVEKKAPAVAPTPPPPGKDPVKDEKKTSDAVVSQITVKQEATSVEFVLDLVLDNPTLTQAHGIAALTAAILRGGNRQCGGEIVCAICLLTPAAPWARRGNSRPAPSRGRTPAPMWTRSRAIASVGWRACCHTSANRIFTARCVSISRGATPAIG